MQALVASSFGWETQRSEVESLAEPAQVKECNLRVINPEEVY